MRHEHHVFHNPPPSTPAEVHAALDHGDLSAALDAMVGTALYCDGDWRELQELYLQLLGHEDHQVSALAGGHLMGVAIARYVVRLEPLTSLDRDTLIALVAPAIQRYLTQPLP